MKITEILKYRFSVTDSISLTNSSNTNVHSGVFRLKHSTVLFVITSLFSCLPQFVNAQMTTIVTCHKVLFCQTPKETAKADKKIAEKKMNAEMKEEKEYKEGKLIQVKDPEGFYANQKNRLFSGPQSAEKTC